MVFVFVHLDLTDGQRNVFICCEMTIMSRKQHQRIFIENKTGSRVFCVYFFLLIIVEQLCGGLCHVTVSSHICIY